MVNRQIKALLSIFYILFAFNLITINDLFLNLPPDFFTLLNVASFVL